MRAMDTESVNKHGLSGTWELGKRINRIDPRQLHLFFLHHLPLTSFVKSSTPTLPLLSPPFTSLRVGGL